MPRLWCPYSSVMPASEPPMLPPWCWRGQELQQMGAAAESEDQHEAFRESTDECWAG
jgi:hypothetical protein